MESIKSIIKFKSIDYAIDLIKNKYIFLNSPFNFNDPLDSYFMTLFSKRGSNESIIFKEYINISREIVVFCGTHEKNINNVLMWSHYSDFHKGIALKYKVPKTLKGKLGKVDYNCHTHEDFIKAIGFGNPSKVPIQNLEEKEKLIFNSIFRKDVDWGYEDEIRYAKRIKY